MLTFVTILAGTMNDWKIMVKGDDTGEWATAERTCEDFGIEDDAGGTYG